MQGRTKTADATSRLYSTAAAEDCGGPLSNLQAASGRALSLSSLPADCFLHSVCGSRVNHRAFDNAPLDDRSVLRSGLRDLDFRRISLSPVCPSRPLPTRQKSDPAFLARTA